jgi:murein DD-endopeptidase MepM/ murein hydrolase activator NlpD
LANPPWVEDLLKSSATTYRLPSANENEDVAGYIRSAASQRGIDPETAIKVAQSEGGLVPNRTGSFSTGKSFWPFQLHYGGPGYEQFGNVAGMGTAFTKQTGYQPGDPTAWKAATDYALDRARESGWGQWYGARNVGVTGFAGIDRSAGRTPPVGSFSGNTTEKSAPPPWVTDLLASEPTTQSTTQQPQSPPSLNAQTSALQDAPPWVRDLLSSDPSAFNEGGSRAAGAAAGYEGPAQTDEVWPVAGHKWGQVNNPFGGTQARSAGATVALPSSNVGADLTASYGEDVVAPVSGTVVEAFDAPNETDRNLNHGWGGSVVLLGDNGFTYRLSHLQPGLRVRPGTRVARGQQLGDVGVSGNTTGPHLDAEKFSAPGKFVDIVAGRGAGAGAGAGTGGTVAPGGLARPVDRSVGNTASLPPWVRDLLGAT